MGEPWRGGRAAGTGGGPCGWLPGVPRRPRPPSTPCQPRATSFGRVFLTFEDRPKKRPVRAVMRYAGGLFKEAVFDRLADNVDC